MKSTQALAVIGCSSRQLDYLTRVGVVPDANPGSGYRRTWEPEMVTRLALAWHVTTALPSSGGQSPWPLVAAAALDPELPEPPRVGWAVLRVLPERLELAWVATWADVRWLAQRAGAVTLVAFDLDDLVGDLDTEH